MTAYYNEINAHAAQWLRYLIAEGLIAPGDVDERDIREVQPDDLKKYTQCHFFAGIGGWSLALRLAGWGDDQGVWTGSCPCQPLSSAGQRKGHADERHLWPAFYSLIAERRPSTIFGEQAASALGREWVAGVRADLDDLGYAVGAADLCAAGIGAPHIRQRLYWLAYAESQQVRGAEKPELGSGKVRETRALGGAQIGRSGNAGGLADADGRDAGAKREQSGGQFGLQPPRRGADFWADFDTIECGDGRVRRLEPGTFPLVDGVPGRLDIQAGYGNAIVPQIAAEFIGAATDVIG